MAAVETAESAETRLIARYLRSYELYARQCLRIRAKSGETVPFKFNRTQRTIHRAVEDQRRRTGMVRMLVLKCRQPGSSTYFSGRSYWKTTLNKGQRAFVLTQDDDTTTNLFGMVKRFHDNVPAFVRPITGASNAKELVFNRLDSGYLVSTAGNKATGRGHTIQVFHASEVAHWPNAEDHVAGVLQAIPNLPGTEVYFESTARGVNNLFHTMVKRAQAGEGLFEFVFTPWHWHEEYEAAAPPDFRPPPEFAEYGALHELTIGQIYWSWLKNADMAVATGGRSDEICWLFRQEYPANAEEAFQTAGTNSFVRGELVMRARKSKIQGVGPIILGVDVARGGEDKTAIVDRQGRRLGGNVALKLDYGKDAMPVAGKVVSLVREMRQAGTPIKKVVVDATGLGGPVYDRLKEMLGDELVAGIEFGGGARDRNRYANRRAEMWDTMLRWFMNEAGAACPDNDDFQKDVCAPAWGDKNTGTQQMTRFRSDGTLILEDKDHMRRRLKFSPDWGDAAALTFAIDFDEFYGTKMDWQPPVQGPGAWML